MKPGCRNIVEIVTREFQPLFGKPCWLVQQGFASNFSLNFGEPHLVVVEPKKKSSNPRRVISVHGQWHLWIYCCHWRIIKANAILAHDESASETIKAALAELDGQVLNTITVQPEQGTSELHFELGHLIRTIPYGMVDDENKPYVSWILFGPEKNAFSYRSDGSCEHEKGELP